MAVVFVILRATIFKSVYEVFSVFVWLFILVGVWLLNIGISSMNLNSTFRKIQTCLQYEDVTVDKLSEITAIAPDTLIHNITLIMNKKYWRNVTVLDNALIIEPFGKENVAHKIYSPKGMRFITKLQGEPIPQSVILIALWAVVSIVPLPFSKWIWFFVAIVLSFPLKRLSSKITNKKHTIIYQEIPQYIPETIKIELSGNESADSIIKQGQKYLAELAQLQVSIQDEHLNKRIREISVGTRQMLEKLKQSPDKYTQVRQTMNYSLPTAIELFHKYRELDSQPIKGENIKRSMDKIHEMSDLVASTFEKELDSMYQDQTIDIEVDIEVMKNLLRQESMELPNLADKLLNDIDGSSQDNTDK